MDNLICHVEECKYNHAKGCSAKEITVATGNPSLKATTVSDTVCEKFCPKSGC